MEWQRRIRAIPDWPRPGVVFRDITPLLQDAAAFAASVEALAAAVRPWRPTHVVGIEARGFIFGAALASALRLGFVPVRKKGKLPAATVEEEYALEYGSDRIAMHVDGLGPDMRPVLLDDLLATGGTAAACDRLARKVGAELAGAAFVIELAALAGRRALRADLPVATLMTL